MKRLFSLVVPTYNVERYLGEFLESLANQTYPIDDIEIVFVDDGSTDSSAEIIAKWIAAVAPSARLIRKENGGLSSARNFGLDHATGSVGHVLRSRRHAVAELLRQRWRRSSPSTAQRTSTSSPAGC